MTSAPLRPADVTVIQRMAARRTRWSKGWQYLRYMTLIAALGQIAVSVWIYCRVQDIMERDPSPATTVLEVEPVTTSQLEFAVSTGNAVGMMWTGAVGLFIFGIFFAGFTYSHWHRHEEDRALQRLSEAVLASLAPEPKGTP